jgi:formylglycine-generating enzyme required for sulfatase activity
MATAHAIVRLSGPDETKAIAGAFDAPIRPHALNAALIQTAAMTIDAAKARQPGTMLNQLVRIAPGEGPFKANFTLGSGDDDQAYESEKPPTPIAMTRAFAIGRYTVTQEEYLAFCTATGRAPLEDAGNRRWPAINVNWRDAMAYCQWLEAITGEGYRLPSEVEWEYACRAGTETRYSWGDDWDDARANSNRTQPNDLHDVGSYDPNDGGLWDMHGNVYEWCADPWHDNYEGRPPGQGLWSISGDYSRRVVRGGSWNDGPQDLRSADRSGDPTDFRASNIGFRLAKTLNP